MAEVSGMIGDQSVELNNAATESTLKQLLAAMTAMAKASGKGQKFEQDLEKELKRLAKEAAKNADAHKAAAADAKKLAKEEQEKLERLKKEKKAAEELAKKTEAEKKAKENLQAAANNAAAKIADVGKELVGLMTGASKLIGTLGGLDDSISKANAALGSIPLVGGFLSTMLGPAADAAEKVYGQFTKLASVGATFGGSFNDMINAATGAGLTMEQFNGIVSKNAQGLAMFGGTTEEGARRLAGLGKEIKKSGMGDSLLRMGYTTEQVNDGMAAYISTMTRTGALQGMSTKQIAAASGNYLKELDMLAKVTGTSREEKQKELDELAKDAQLNAALSGMSREEQEKVRQQIALLPKAHQGAVKDMIATGNISTDAAIKFNAMMPQAAAKYMQMGRTLEAGGKITEGAMKGTYDNYIDEAKIARDRNKGLVRFNREFDNEYAGIVEASSRQKGAIDKARGEQENVSKNAESSAEALGKFKQQVAAQGNQFTNALQDSFIKSGAMEALQTAFTALSKFAMDYVVPALQMMFRGISTVVNFLTGPTMTTITGFVLAFAPLAAAIAVAVFAVKGLMAASALVGGGLTAAAGAVAAFAWPVTLAVGAVIALYAAMKYFNVDLTQVANFLGDTFMDAFRSVSDFMEDIFQPAFDVISDVINDIVMPAFSALGSFIADTVLETFAALRNSIKPVAEYLSEKLGPAFQAIGTVIGKITAFYSDMYNKGLHFMRGFDSLGSVTNYLGEIFKEFSLFIKGMSMSLREKLSWLPGITAPSAEEKEALERERTELADEKRDAAAEREKVAQRRDQEAADKQKQRDREREDRDKKIAADRKKRDDDYAKEKSDKEKGAIEEATSGGKKGVDYSNPVAMYKSFKDQQTSTGTPATAGTTATAGGATSTGVPAAALNQDQAKNMELIKAALQKQGITDPKYIAATMGNVMKETGGKSISENLNYGNTSNDRIRSIFGKRASGKTDQELDTIKKDPQQMGEMMYGSKTDMGQKMGNTEAGDGWKYRGRGFIQLTGKNNYAQASKAIYGDDRLVKNPDLVNDPAVAAEVSAWYMKKGQASMAKSMGIDTGNMSQEQANLLATSQVAGGDVRKKGSYLSGEVMDKVNKYSGQLASAAGAPVSDSAKTALSAVPAATAKPAMTEEAIKKQALAGGVNTAALTKYAGGAGTDYNSIVNSSSTAKTEIIAAAEQKAKAEADAKVAAEKARTETASTDPRRVDKKTEPTAPAQESAESLLAQLNNKMDQLIKATNRTVDLNDKQLSVQRSMSGNLYA